VRLDDPGTPRLTGRVVPVACGRALAAIVDAARARVVTPAPAALLLVAAGFAIAVALARIARRRGALVITPTSLAGAIGLVVVLLAIVVTTRGQMSPSYVPSLARTEQRGGIGIAIALVLQITASWRVVRRAPDRVAAANGAFGAAATLALAVLTRRKVSQQGRSFRQSPIEGA
jgi:hypothetical protein